MNRILSGVEAKKKLISGINLVADIAKITMGAEGKTVFIERSHDLMPYATKDGVTAVHAVYGRDSFEEMGVKIVKQATNNVVNQVGDGTSATSVLTQSLVNAGFQALENYSHVTLNKEIDETHKLVVKELEKLSRVTDYENKKHIATISANGDAELGTMIADLYEELGDDLAITVKEGVGKKTTSTKVQGLVVESGIALPYFAEDEKQMSLNFIGGVNVLVVRGKISDLSQISEPLRESMNTSRALLIMADDIEEGVMKVLVEAKLKSGKRISVTINDSNGRKDEYLEDVYLFTDAQPLDLRIDSPTFKFGEVKEVFSDQNKTVFIPEGLNTKIKERVGELKVLAEEADNLEKTHILKRISNLQAAVAEITVGGATDMEIKERKDRVDDAVLAVKSAIKGGFVAGGGTTLFYISDKLKSKVKTVGGRILLETLKRPMLQILENAKIEPPKKIIYGKGIDVRKRKSVDLFKAGVVDSTRVIKSCLENAVSVSTVIFTTDVLILNEDPKYIYQE